MRKKNKKILTIEELLTPDKRILYSEKYKRILSDAKGNSEMDNKLIDDFKLSVGKYSLRTRIKNNPWLKGRQPASTAIKWLFKEVYTNPSVYRHNKLIMHQGALFQFNYKNPKYKNTKQLPWFDKHPLVISLGPIVTKKGIRNLGFNLHLLPPKIRIIVMCKIFELYKKLYRYQIFYKQERPVQIKYQEIIKALNPYGIKFCVRMYIPKRMTQIVCFPYRDWYKAVFIPSQGYDSIKAASLIQEWQKYVRKAGYSTSKNINWGAMI